MNKIEVHNTRRVGEFLGFNVKPYENLYENPKCNEFIEKYKKYLNSTKKEDFEEFFSLTGIILRHHYLCRQKSISFDILGSNNDRSKTPQIFNSHLVVVTYVKTMNIENGIIYADGEKIYDLEDDKSQKEKLNIIDDINVEFINANYDNGTNDGFLDDQYTILKSYFKDSNLFEEYKYMNNHEQIVLSPFGDIFTLTTDGTLYRNDTIYDHDVEYIFERDRYTKLIIFKDKKVEYISSTFGNPMSSQYEKLIYTDTFLGTLKDTTLTVIQKLSKYNLEKNSSVDFCIYGINEIEYDYGQNALVLNNSSIKLNLDETFIESYDTNYPY